MVLTSPTTRPATGLLHRFMDVRALTEALAAPLSPEDQTAQSMPSSSPTRWHRAHTTWFFEEFLVAPNVAGYEPFDSAYRFLFNSYYESVGPRQQRAARGVITRPGNAEIAAYRAHVDEAMAALLRDGLPEAALDLIEIGLHHEQQHQELLLTDIKHVLSQNVTDPVYRPTSPSSAHRVDKGAAGTSTGWVGFDGGRVEIGSSDDGFTFDNERPAHPEWLQPFELATRPVSNRQVLGFIDDGGYQRPEFWLADGWATVQTVGWTAPLYWDRDGDTWTMFTLAGRRPVEPDEPAVHLSYYEADAIAQWLGARLPTEVEWEIAAAGEVVDGNLLDLDVLHPRPAGEGAGLQQLFGDVWEWTSSAYLPYPGFRTAPGAVGEYNGKFMIGQHVLRGGACVTPPGHIRPTYRNFFPPSARWVFSGMRVARDPDS